MTVLLLLLVLTTCLTIGGLLLRRAEPTPGLPPPWWLLALACLIAAGAALGARSGPSSALSQAALTIVATSPACVVAARPLTARWTRVRARRAGIGLPPFYVVRDEATLARIVLDKHRTVTTGEMQISSVDPLDPEHRTNLLFFAGALSRRSTAPFAVALARRAGGGRVSDYRESDPNTLSGSVDRHPVRLGPPATVGMTSSTGRGLTVGVEVDQRTLGTITLEDTVRPHARDDVRRIEELAPLVLLSDDTPGNTSALGTLVGVDELVAEADAVARLEQVQKAHADGGRVAMIAPRQPHNEDALHAADIAVTDAATPAAPGVITLDEFDLATADDALRRALAGPKRIHQVEGVALALSCAGALAGAVAPLGAYGAGASALGASAIVAVAAWLNSRPPRALPDRSA